MIVHDQRLGEDFARDGLLPTLRAVGRIQRDDVAVARADDDHAAADFGPADSASLVFTTQLRLPVAAAMAITSPS